MDIKLQDYLPDPREIDRDKLLDARSRLETFFQRQFPEMDIRPNSVFGDLIVDPLAHWMAAQDIATDRVLSDFQLQNIARGVIYNCDFVRSYIHNFSVHDIEGALAWGVVRLIFSDDVERTLDRKTEFLFGRENLFRLLLSFDGALTVKPVGSPREPDVNMRVLSQIGENLYAVDVPVEGHLETDVVAGNAASLNVTPNNLVSATAIDTFQPGSPSELLQDLAERAMKVSTAAVPANRSGLISLANVEFPDLLSFSPVLPGDDEMIRDEHNIFGAPDRKADLYVRTKRELFEDVITVRLDFRNGPESFTGKVDFPGLPWEIVNVTPVADPDVDIDPTWYSQSSNAVSTPLASAAYSSNEDLFVSIPMPTDNGTPLLSLQGDIGNTQYAFFTITYKYDPNIRAVLDRLLSDVNRPISIDPVGKLFIPCFIDELKISYRRTRGHTVNLSVARQEIFDYVNKVTYPDIISDAPIVDAMLYAGTKNVRDIQISAHVAFTVANQVVPGDEVLDGTDQEFSDAQTAARNLPAVEPDSISSLRVDFRDPDLGTATETFAAIGTRSVTYVLSSDNIVFEEV